MTKAIKYTIYSQSEKSEVKEKRKNEKYKCKKIK